MSWNPFKRREEAASGEAGQPQSGGGSAAAGQGSGEDDPTDPLIQSAAFREESRTVLQWPGVRLESVSIGAARQDTDGFLRLVVEQEGPLAAALPDMLTTGGALFGLRDLLADNDNALSAALDEPWIGLQELQEEVREGRLCLRVLDVLLAMQQLAAGLELAAAHGLGWNARPASLAFGLSGDGNSGLARWQLRFLGFGELSTDTATDAAEILTLLLPLLDAACADAALLPDAAGPAELRGFISTLQQDPQLTTQSLAEAISARLRGMIISGAGITHEGMRRKHNEDAWLLAELQQHSAVGAGFLLAAVADGMGGHESGEIASSLSLAMLRQQLQVSLISPSTRGSDAAALPQQLRSVIPGINRALCDRGAMEQSLAGMGTTLCGFAMLATHSTLGDARAQSSAIFNVGDSRCYLVGPQRLLRLTKDHSFVQGLVDSGEVSEDEAFDHPRKNVITRCLGGDGLDIEADIYPFTPGPCERLLICSDGLSDALRDSEIRRVLEDCRNSGAQATLQALVDAANAAGGPDNITVLLLDCSI